jgi:hypothetical protein
VAAGANRRSDDELEFYMGRARAQMSLLRESRGEFLRSVDDAIDRMASVSGRPNRFRSRLVELGESPRP